MPTSSSPTPIDMFTAISASMIAVCSGKIISATIATTPNARVTSL
jgi:hypothetical protein